MNSDSPLPPSRESVSAQTETPIATPGSPRILIVDDNPAIHEDFRKILGEQMPAVTRLTELETRLFGPSDTPVKRASFRLDSAFQGQEGLRMLQRAVEQNDPYSLAFVDVRMPPGWDGLETLEHFWKCCPDVQAVICTAYSDYSWEQITRRLKQSDNLLILKKPFDAIEALQVAHAMTRKWELGRQARLRMEDLDRMVRERTQALRAEIEERLRVQENLRHTEERFAKAFDASPLPMAIQSCADGRFLDANQSFLDLTGYDSGELIGRSARDLRLWPENDTTILAATRAEGRFRNQQYILHRRDRKSRTTLMWTEPMTLETGASQLLIVEDVTDRLKLESQLRQAQKMEAVGCLATGIAHEFNNLLTVIQGHAGLLRTGCTDGRFRADSVERITQASLEAASLTRRLLIFSRKQPLQIKPLNLSKTVQNMRRMLSRLVGEHYELQLNCEPQLPLVQADEPGFQQAVINLVLNARDSMPAGGAIHLEMTALALDAEAARDHVDARPGRFVCFSIADTGCGMTPEIAGRVFEPFFTTKEVGKGTGLGLSAVHGIVQQHDGWIQVATQPGRGSTFKVFLPICENTIGETSVTETISQNGTCGAGEAVLLVEDEPSVRELARLTLEQGGYRVFEAADGPEALTVWEKSPVHIDLLVTDMVMPKGVTGTALAKALVNKDPRLRAIITSGYTSEMTQDEESLVPGGRFLSKPYDPLTLLRTVKLSLDDKSRLSIAVTPLSDV
jgi:two-component system cell cycle sensor histidine kinase/response regulator CckA